MVEKRIFIKFAGFEISKTKHKMVKVNLGGCSSFVNDADYKTYVQKALAAFDTLQNEDGAGNDFLGWKTLPIDITESLICDIEAVRDSWKAKGVNLVVVIGIGGSYLGAKCAIEALSHSFVRPADKPQVVFAGNNLSEEYLAELMDLAKTCNTAVIVISKSGTTTEPAVAFRIFKEYVEQTYGKAEAAERIVAITDAKKGALKTLATQEGYKSFIVPDNVGGRYSVLTPVGLVPIAVAGFDIRAMLKGAAEEREALLVKSEDNAAVQYAAMRNLLHLENGKSTEILVTYNPKFTYLAEWWKQLYGESEGKDLKGIFPASVTNTADLHSMGQFIQEGSRIMFETVVNIEKANRSVVIGSDEQNLDQLNYLAGQHVNHCNAMAQLGTKLAHIDGGVPQMEVSIENINEENLGAIFYFFEFSCGISAYVLGINPFNQPGVEAYKKNMFALLRKPGFEAQTEAILKRI
ncbi:MAG: glucose-6-phosphate isomerase [Bacteroidales bacterium]|nr:glucose-6-phosphate isomerase [Candidatus Cryptobacteroides onthequi]